MESQLRVRWLWTLSLRLMSLRWVGLAFISRMEMGHCSKVMTLGAMIFLIFLPLKMAVEMRLRFLL